MDRKYIKPLVSVIVLEIEGLLVGSNEGVASAQYAGGDPANKNYKKDNIEDTYGDFEYVGAKKHNSWSSWDDWE